MLGILLIDKPVGITSHDVVNDMRRRLGTRRVGHAGTLDPLACGLLVVAVGPATRFLQYLPLEPKVYLADIEFGYSSSTYDAEGEPIPGGPVPDDLAGAIESAISNFKGLISQLPPLYSAVKVGGRPLYKYARDGKSPVREPRTVHIEAFDILGVSGNTAKAHISCSGGTYVRSLANDLGEAIGCGAYLTSLVRTSVGRFRLADAQSPEDVTPSLLVPLKEALRPMAQLQLDEDETTAVREGRAIIRSDPPPGNLAALLDPRGEVFSIARIAGNVAQPECVIPSEVSFESA